MKDLMNFYCRYPLARKIFVVSFLFLNAMAQAQDQSPLVAQDTPPSQEAVGAQLFLTAKEKGKGIPLSRVEVRAGNSTFFTDPKGQVTIQVNPEVKELNLYRSGFERLTIPITPAANEEISVFLIPALPEEDNVVNVRGERKAEVSRKVISGVESRKIAPSGDPAQVTKLLPGVSTSGFSQQLIVRGSGPEDSLYFYDATQTSFLYHPIGDLSILPPGLIKDVEFYSGGFGPEYGGATGGVVVLRTKDDLAERPFTEIWSNIPIYSGLYHERPLSENTSLSMSVRYSTLELIVPAILDQMDNDAGKVTLLPRFGDAHVQWLAKEDYGYNKILGVYAFDGFALRAPSDISENTNGDIQLDFNGEFAGLTWETKRKINQDWTLSASPTLVYTENRANFLSNQFLIRTRGIQLPASLQLRINKDDRFSFGLRHDHRLVDVNFLLPKLERDNPFFDFEEAPKLKLKDTLPTANTALWALYEKKLGDWTLAPGIRTFHDVQINQFGYDPRLSVRYAINAMHTAKAAVGQYSKDPEPDQSDETFGNPDVKYERSNHYILGLETKWTQFWDTDLQIYHKDFYDLIREVEGGTLANSGSKASTGFELFLRRQMSSRFFGWISYTLAKTKERQDRSEAYRASEFDQTHVLQAVGNYRLTTTWETAARYSFQTGKPYTPITNAVYNVNLDKYQPRSSAELYSQRLPAKHTVSVSATKEFLMDTWTLFLRFGVESLRIGDRTEQIGYNYDYSRQENVETLPAIPFIELRATL